MFASPFDAVCWVLWVRGRNIARQTPAATSGAAHRCVHRVGCRNIRPGTSTATRAPHCWLGRNDLPVGERPARAAPPHAHKSAPAISGVCCLRDLLLRVHRFRSPYTWNARACGGRWWVLIIAYLACANVCFPFVRICWVTGEYSVSQVADTYIRQGGCRCWVSSCRYHRSLVQTGVLSWSRCWRVWVAWLVACADRIWTFGRRAACPFARVFSLDIRSLASAFNRWTIARSRHARSRGQVPSSPGH
jgi:hypothetical protein